MESPGSGSGNQSAHALCRQFAIGAELGPELRGHVQGDLQSPIRTGELGFFDERHFAAAILAQALFNGSAEPADLAAAATQEDVVAHLGLELRIVGGDEVLERLWFREMPLGVYEPRWLRCQTEGGVVKALAFTLPSQSPQNTGHLSPHQYRHIFSDTVGGRYGTTLDYAQQTYVQLLALGIHDQALADLLRWAP